VPITESNLSADLRRLGLRADAAVLSHVATLLGLATGRTGGVDKESHHYHAKHGVQAEGGATNAVEIGSAVATDGLLRHALSQPPHCACPPAVVYLVLWTVIYVTLP
jgi:hypothetical protein